MKKQIIISILIATLFLFGSNSHIFAALDPLPEANAPFNQRDRYQTDLFTGSATYTYPVKVPKGTNDLAPAVCICFFGSITASGV